MTTDGETSVPTLSEKARELLSVEKRRQKEKTFALHPELAACWKEIVVSGMELSNKKSMEEKYPTKGNCPLKAPELNAELFPLLHKTAKNRDKYMVAIQEMCARGLVAIGNAICAIFNDEEEPVDKDQLLENLCDASSMFCEVTHQLSKTRKHQIYQHVDDKRKAILEQSETGFFLFGEDLGKRIQTASAAEKVGLSIKTPAERKQTPVRRTLNWRGSSAFRGGPRQTSFFNRTGPRTAQNFRPSNPTFRNTNKQQNQPKMSNNTER